MPPEVELKVFKEANSGFLSYNVVNKILIFISFN